MFRAGRPENLGRIQTLGCRAAAKRATMSKRRPGGRVDHRRMSCSRPDVAIVGGGIAGLVTALCLDAVGVGCEVWERAPGCPELGVGINLLPPAVEVLARLGLLDELDRHGIRTSELILATRRGQHVWREPRGLAAGHAVPQLSIHVATSTGSSSGRFAIVLGDRRLHLGVAVEPGALPDGTIVLGADGIHSAVRATIVGDGAPRWNGVLMWRGATRLAAVPRRHDDGRRRWHGGQGGRLPDRPGASRSSADQLGGGGARRRGRRRRRRAGRTGPGWPRGPTCSGSWAGSTSPRSICAGLVAATERIYEYPMCDRDPLPTWTHGNVTLIGDAAHPMYPMGSNGGTRRSSTPRRSPATSRRSRPPPRWPPTRPNGARSPRRSSPSTGPADRSASSTSSRSGHPMASPGAPTSSATRSCGPCSPSTAG